MSATTLSGASLTAAQQQFEAALPSMDNVIRHHFRNWPARRRAEALADARAAIWASWVSMLLRGKDPLQVGVTGIAARCCLYTQSGRKLGNTSTGRGCLDVMDRRARRRLGIKIVSLDDPTGTELASGSDGWRQWLAESNVVTPANEACFRLDFATWLSGLAGRKKEMAEMLAEGHETGLVAGMVGVSPGRVSQVRLELEASWKAFQGEVTSDEVAPARKPVDRPREADQAAPRRPRKRTAEPVLEQVS